MFDRTAHPASFDSASVMARAVARSLRQQDMPMMGDGNERLMRPVLSTLNRLPLPARRWLYAVGSGRERLPQRVVARTDAEALSRTIVDRYPRRRFPGAVIGSNPGSMSHLCAAFGLPLLPQTLLLPVAREDVGVDEPRGDIDAVRDTARAMLDANPDLVLHHMMDPSFDRLTLRWFSYFRVKRTRLGSTYERFLRETLEPGATLFVADCTRRWPVVTVGERHFFQFGGVGGPSPSEYYQGGDRVRELLAADGSALERWDVPQPDDEQPEAEWGLQPALADDVERFADEHGYRVRRITFSQADEPSPLVADLYRWWYARLGMPTDRLFVECFALLDPWLVMEAGAVPFWSTFNGEPAASALEAYLDGLAEPYDVIDLALISHGTDSIGLASLDRWRGLLARARQSGRFSGVDERRYPADLAAFARWRERLQESRPRHPVPQPMALSQLDEFVADAAGRHKATIT